MKLIKNLFKLVILFIFVQANAQEVEFGPLVKTKAFTNYMLPVSSGKYFTIGHSTANFTKLTPNIKFYKKFEEEAKGKVLLKVNNKKAYFSSAIAHDGKILVFLIQETKTDKNIYFQEYDESCAPTNDPQLIISLTKVKRNNGSFFITQSKNKEFFCVQYSKPGLKADKERIGYITYNIDLEIVKEGNYETEYTNRESNISDYHLSNKGELFMVLEVYNTNDKGKVKSENSIKKLLICMVNEKELETFEIDLGLDKKIKQLSFDSDEKEFFNCTGIYDDKKKKNQGIFYLQFNFKEKKVVNIGVNPFTKDLISTYIDEDEGKKSKKSKTPALSNYFMQEVKTLEDGSLIAYIESFIVKENTTTDSKGNTRTYYTYIYGDIIAYRVSNDGTFKWVTIIKKTQSSNNTTMFSSFFGYLENDKYTMYFNDILKNYDESGKYNRGKGSALTHRFNKKRNCLVKMVMDINTGKFERNIFLRPTDTKKSFPIPAKFKIDESTKEIILYFRLGKKEMFGKLDY